MWNNGYILSLIQPPRVGTLVLSFPHTWLFFLLLYHCPSLFPSPVCSSLLGITNPWDYHHCNVQWHPRWTIMHILQIIQRWCTLCLPCSINFFLSEHFCRNHRGDGVGVRWFKASQLYWSEFTAPWIFFIMPPFLKV